MNKNFQCIYASKLSDPYVFGTQKIHLIDYIYMYRSGWDWIVFL